jgi:hypothetical protein
LTTGVASRPFSSTGLAPETPSSSGGRTLRVVACYVVRVWMPDRPGALGSVASRIGAVGGDLLAIDILEREGGVAVDELAVELASPDLVALLRSEVREVDGVGVEEIRKVAAPPVDPRVAGFELAATLMAISSVETLLVALAKAVRQDLDSTWSVVIDLGSPVPLATQGDAPPVAWLNAFVEGTAFVGMVRTAPPADEPNGPCDVAWACLDAADLALVVGRSNRPFLGRERRRLAATARIADARWAELVMRSSRLAHPSTC